MKQALLNTLPILSIAQTYTNRINQLQTAVDEQLEQIKNYKTHISKDTEFLTNFRRYPKIRTSILFGIVALILIVGYIVLLCRTDIEMDTAVICSFIWQPFLGVCIGNLIGALCAHKHARNNLCTLTSALKDLEQGDGYHQRLCQLDEIDELIARRDRHLLDNREALAILPEDCRYPEAVNFIIGCFDNDLTQNVSAAARIWTLTKENRMLQTKLETIKAHNMTTESNLQQTLQNQDTSYDSDIDIIIFFSLLDSFD